MKKYIRLLCIMLCLCFVLGSCSQQTVTPEVDNPGEAGNFAPETTAVSSSGLLQAIDTQTQAASVEPTPTNMFVAQTMLSGDMQAPADDPMPEDMPADEPEAMPESEPEATIAPQTNAAITGYSQIGGTSLGFSYSYPVNWINMPGRHSICYKQPVTSPNDYPARVIVTIKELAHKCDAEKAQKQLVSYLENLMTQYDEKTFEVGTLDTETKFLGKKAFSTTYLAYDGDTEIKGYVILTYSKYYVLCYHFVCDYDDYDSFESAIYYMRDSVAIEEE